MRSVTDHRSKDGVVVVLSALLLAVPSWAWAVEAPELQPGDLIRKLASGADSLHLVEYSTYDGEATKTLLRVDDRKAIAELLSVIHTVVNGYTNHMCVGSSPIRLYRGKQLLAEFSFDHESTLRGLSENLWGGDVELTEESADAIARWFQRHGYPEYIDELDRKRSETQRQKAFYDSFPKAVQKTFRENNGMSLVMVGERFPPGVDDAIAKAIPDPAIRARTICRALGLLEGDWFTIGREEQMVLQSASELDAAVLAAAIDSFQDGSPELEGAGRLLFGAQVDGNDWLSRLTPETAERLAARVAHRLLLRDVPSTNARHVPKALRAFGSQRINRVLAAAAGRAGAAAEGTCNEMLPHPSLSALVILASRGVAAVDAINLARSRPWRCPVNVAAVNLALSLACDVLPDPADLLRVDGSAALIALDWMKRHPGRDTIDFAFEGLASHDWAIVREETLGWLRSFPGAPQVERPSSEKLEALLRWWSAERSGFPVSMAPATVRAGHPHPAACGALPEVPRYPSDTAGTRPRSARLPALDDSTLELPAAPQDRLAVSCYQEALALARASDVMSLKGSRKELDAQLRRRKARVQEAQVALASVCDEGPPPLCVAATFAEALLLERFAHALRNRPCPPEFEGNRRMCHVFARDEGFEQQARQRFRATIVRCGDVNMGPWCERAYEGLHRLAPWAR